MIKRGLVVLFLVACTYIHLRAQVIPYIGFDIGGTVPIGSFRQTDFTNRNSGFAKGGVALNAKIGLRIKSGLCFELLYGTYVNSFDMDEYASSINSNYGTRFYSSTDNGGDYRNGFLMPGIRYRKSFFKDKLAFLLGGQIGYSWSERPIVELYMDDPVKNIRYVYSENAMESEAVAWGVNAGFEVLANELVNLGVHLSYLQSVQEFDYNVRDQNNNLITMHYNVPVQLFVPAFSVKLNIM